ncbi:phosphodiester glycosidase family protein, partial [Eubacteriales bacterium OttesenSCG-928-N14]|nr:phosphodiester glycosidase family protein [Eubacteriales bacterium OttesenSCG-928-N14]
PSLLDAEGKPLESIKNHNIHRNNPRSAIGYVEPGHYVMVVVDGRQTASEGMTLTALAELFSQKGCKVAYNLDGGQTAEMAWQGELISVPYEGGRAVGDIVMIVEE